MTDDPTDKTLMGHIADLVLMALLRINMRMR